MVFLIGLIVIGIILLVLEILVLPGMVGGIIGGILIVYSIATMYADHGSAAGNITFASTIVVAIGAIYASLKSKAWYRFGLKETIDGKVNEIASLGIIEGDEGRTVSALRPSGTVMINNKKVEAQSGGEMIDVGTKVVVTKVLPSKIVVKIKVSEL